MSGDPARLESDRWARWLYALLWYLGSPLVVGYLLWRSLRQPAYRRRWSQRFGLRFPPRTGSALIWVHAVSVGETVAARPLVDALIDAYPQCRILLTHMTPTGFETGERLFGDRVERCVLPYDMPHASGRFLNHYRPVAGILIETELWPALMASARSFGLPVALVNARLSPRSLRRARRFRALIVPALARLSLVVAQTDADAKRLAELERSAVVAGNQKFDVDPDPVLIARGRRWRGQRRAGVILAASTRDGEESLLLDEWPSTDKLLVIVPRHPQRFEQVAALMDRAGAAPVRRRSRVESLADIDVPLLLGDSMGEMPAYYAMADLTILGGSLLPFGGQNLIESCAVGTPVILGPHTFNFSLAAEQAVEAGAALRVGSAAEAVETALAIVANPRELGRMREAALAFAANHRGATARTMRLLAPLLSGANAPG